MPHRTHLPSLESICIEVVSEHDYWIVQKRHLQYLPEDAANHLLQLLLWRGRLQSPSLLDTFRHSATRLHIDAKYLGLQLGAEWIAYIAGLSHLQQLSLQHATRLKDRHLAPLTRLSSSLTSLDITGCSSITNRACGEVLSQLTALQSLVLTGTGIRPPILSHLTSLTCLTHLYLGACEVSDDDITHHITTFQHLQHLDVWGSGVGDASVVHLNQLPHLQQLSMAWSRIRTVIPLRNSLTSLDLSHCHLEGSWHEAEQLFGAAGGLRLQELVVLHTEVSAAYAEVLEAMIRSSSKHLQLLDLTEFSGCDLLPLLLALESAAALHTLSLAATGLTDDYCPTLTPCSALRTLDLSQNPEVTDAGLRATVPALQGLRRLNLQGTGFGDDGLEVLWALPDLQELVLADTPVAWEWTAPAAAGGAASEQPQQQQQPAVAARVKQPEVLRTGWSSLLVLHLPNTRVDDTGCMQLAQQLGQRQNRVSRDGATADESHRSRADEGSGAVGASGDNSSSSSSSFSSGLSALSIGSSKISKKGLAALAKISSLQRLTLQHCQLQDRDLKHLGNLQWLQALHIRHVDPWLLSDQALEELPDAHDMPQLMLITRDGRTVYSAAVPPAAEAGDNGVGAFNLPSTPAVAGQQQQSWWQQDHLSLVGAPSGLQTVSAASSSRFGSWPDGGASTAPARAATPRAGSSSSKKPLAGSSMTAAASTVYKRLSEYDERFKYSKEELLELRAADSAGADSPKLQVCGRLESIPDWLRASSEDRWR